MLRDMGVVANPLNATNSARPHNATQQQMTRVSRVGSMSNAGTTDFDGCVRHGNVALNIYFVYAFFIANTIPLLGWMSQMSTMVYLNYVWHVWVLAR